MAEGSALACSHCNDSLVGVRYILREEKPLCVKCYEQVFAQVCFACKQSIGCEAKDLSFSDKHWHEKCFVCHACKAPLADKMFASKDDDIYCSECFDVQFSARCDGCQQVFKAGSKKYEFKGKQWHEECFCCALCKHAIGSKSFIPRDQDVVCVACYEDKFAQRCGKCSQVISRGGITYKGQPWHKECFLCDGCKKQLAGIKFTCKDDVPYCIDCYGRLFAKTCARCAKPITGAGGTKFVSFEDQHWHSECFVCSKCTASLIGKGFLTDGSEIVCPDCSQQAEAAE